jgi:hypothetical protein
MDMEALMNPDITVCTCWDGRDYYPKEYINILHRMVERHTTIPHDFVLYAGPEAQKPGRCDGINPAIRVVFTGMPSWWNNAKITQPDPVGIRTKTILFLDLDIVIISNIDRLIEFPSEYAMSVEYPSGHLPVGQERYAMKSRNANIGVTLIRNNAAAKVWEEYQKAGAPKWDAITTRVHDRGALPLATQTIVNDPKYGIKYDLFPSDWVASYKYQVLKRGIPKDCMIVHFHGRPKMHEVDEPFVRENWK